MNILPFEHSFDRAEVKGKILREVLERSASQWEEKSGQFLQVFFFKGIVWFPYHSNSIHVHCSGIRNPSCVQCQGSCGLSRVQC